jgi:hypothetical protein
MAVVGRGERERLPRRRPVVTYKLRLGGVGVHFSVGTYPDSRLAEIFVELAKPGSHLKSVFQAWAVQVSKALQYGAPLHELVDSFLDPDNKVAPCGEFDCEDLPELNGKKFKTLWQCLSTILLHVTDKEGRLK